MRILLKSRWHSLQEPEQDPEKWRRGFIESGKTDPLSDHPFRERLRTIWQRVSESLGFGRKRREREQRRQNNRRMAEHAITRIWPSLGEEAKRRLAQHHATMIVCSDLEEVGRWAKHLKRAFPSAETQTDVAGFVYWLTNPEGKRLAVVVWNGVPSSTPEPYIYGHEIAHIVDGDPNKTLLSAQPEWLDLWQQQKNDIALMLMSQTRTKRMREDATEAFATLLAVAWTEPRYLQGRGERFLEYFRRHGLLLASPSTPRTRGDPAR